MENIKEGFFEYTCKYWDEFEKGIKIVHGVVYASNWSDAMYKLECYYDNIENIFIQGVEPSSVYEFETGTVNFKINVKELNIKEDLIQTLNAQSAYTND